MDNKWRRLAGGVGSFLVLTGFALGVVLQIDTAWLLLLAGAFFLAYAIYCGSRPFLRGRID